jgi:flotillin
MAYELQKKTMEIQVQEQEIKRTEKELDATIRRQADAKRYETETLAGATRTRIEAEAGAERARLEMIAEGEKARGLAAAAVAQAQGVAEAEVAKARGLAEAEARKAQGLAEALGMEKKAEAWQKYNEAAVLQILAPILPEIARAVAEPLSRIDRITMVNTGNGTDGGISKITAEVARIIAQMPPVVESLTGIKVEELLNRSRITTTPPAEGPAKPASDDRP